MTLPESGITAGVTTGHINHHLEIHKILNRQMINIRDPNFAVTGNGTTDDRAAIEAVWAAGGQGKAYFYPPGDYLINSGTGLTPPAGSVHIGTHIPRWDVTNNLAASGCKLRLGSSFTGTALIKAATDGSTKGVQLRNLGLAGNGVGSGINGIQFQTNAQTTGEMGWNLNTCSIAGFTGHGITGRLWVVHADGLHIAKNGGYGLTPGTGSKWNDTFWSNCHIYFNVTGGLWLGESGNTLSSDYNNFSNCRFERSGGQYTVVGTPLNNNAPGILITRGQRNGFVNCNTDANTGCGVQIEPSVASMSGNIRFNLFTNCNFNRDGSSDAVTAGNVAGVKVRGFSTTTGTDGANFESFINCSIQSGKPDDAGVIGPVAPKYGLWVENAEYFTYISQNTEGATNNTYYGTGGQTTLWKPNIQVTQRLLNTIPTGNTAGRPTEGLIPGMTYWDSTIGKPIWYNGTVWKDSAGTTV